MELSTKDFLQAEKLVNTQNDALLKRIGTDYGKTVLDEIEYELFADTGSVGAHEVVDAPKGEHEKCEDAGKVGKVDKWKGDPLYAIVGRFAWQLEYGAFEPATETEYLTYINSKP